MSTAPSSRLQQMRRRLSGHGGFSLVEIMLVLAIAAVLVVTIFMTFTFGQKIQRDNRRKDDLHLIAQNLDRLQESRVNHSYYPWNTDGPNNAGACPPAPSCFAWYLDPAYAGINTSSYATSPSLTDPLTAQPYKYVGLDTVTADTTYPVPSSARSATITYRMGWACGVDPNGGTPFNSGVYRLIVNLENGSTFCLDNH